MQHERWAMTGHSMAQAAGAIGDNLYRTAGAYAITAALAAGAASSLAGDAAASSTKAAFGLALMIPFVVLAAVAGRIADRCAKHRVVLVARLVEIPIGIIGGLGVVLASPTLLLVAMSLLGIQSALSGPSRYALIPELVAHEQLAVANGRFQAVTSAAILAGTGLAMVADPNVLHGTWLAPLAGGWAVLSVGMAVAVAGIVGALMIPAQPARGSGSLLAGTWRFWSPLAALRKRDDQASLWGTAMTQSGFWMVGAVVQIALSGIAVHQFQLGELGNAGLAVALGVGVMAGALLVPKLHQRSHPHALPIIGMLLTSSALLLGISSGSLSGLVVGLLLAGIGGACWVVPCTIRLQEAAPIARRGEVIAAANLLNCVGIVVALAVLLAVSAAGWLGSSQQIQLTAWLSLSITLVLAYRQRMALLAWLLGRLIRLVYRLRITGLEHLPREGGCVVVANHVSLADGPVLFAALPRPIKALVYGPWTRAIGIGPVLRAMGAIPIDSERGARALTEALAAATEAAANGEVVVIFAEGKLSRSGALHRFQRGIERVARRAEVPIVPCWIGDLHGAVVSRAKHRRRPTIGHPIALRFGAPLPPTTSAAEVRDHVTALSFADATARAERNTLTLGRATLRRAKRHPFRTAVVDAGGSLNRLMLAAIARCLATKLNLPRDEQRVGVLLPPGRGGALVNLALALQGRTAVNLNHTVGADGLETMVRLAGLKRVITAKLYRRRIDIEAIGDTEIVDLEDVLPAIPKWRILLSAAVTWLSPSRWLDHATPDDIACLVFSSGTTGDPKGVQLSHRQLLANMNACVAHLQLTPDHETLLNALPLFHSFGLCTGTWLGLTSGFTVAGHPDPTDAAGLGKLCQATAADFMISTPTFARAYLRRLEPEAMASLRLAVVGAEKCPADLRVAFLERFGCQLLEGYGCTELAPVASVNVPDTDLAPHKETGTREGSVGRALPGIEIITIDPDSHEVLPRGETGLLVVRSPGRMAGYLGRDDLTEAAFVHDGYNTGDVGYLDEDGFIFITGRLARFAKIGGEMVPLERVQETLLDGLAADREAAGIDLDSQTASLAIAAVPDQRRGERLVVLHTGLTHDAATIVGWAEPLPALFRPRGGDVHQVDALPTTGTGKLDLRALNALARAVANGDAVPT